MEKIVVTLVGAAAIVFVYWFFLRKNEKPVSISGSTDIIVDGGYAPSSIQIKKGETTLLNFIRRDPSSCLEEVILSDFHVRKFLPLNKKVSITLNPKKTGTFDFSCGMGMFHGKLVVTE